MLVCILSVGFEIACLYRRGKFEGLECEISNRYGPHAFIMYVAHS